MTASVDLAWSACPQAEQAGPTGQQLRSASHEADDGLPVRLMIDVMALMTFACFWRKERTGVCSRRKLAPARAVAALLKLLSHSNPFSCISCHEDQACDIS